jgi:hypothetical protein
MSEQEKKLSFQFTVDETNAILSALGDLPFVKSAAIIQAIQIQAMPQMAEMNAQENPENQE